MNKQDGKRIESFELAYRMQREATELVDFNTETAATLHLLSIDHKQLTFFHNGRRYRLTDVARDGLTTILA